MLCGKMHLAKLVRKKNKKTSPNNENDINLKASLVHSLEVI